MRPNRNVNGLPSPESSPDTSPCSSHKTLLRKGATFHESSRFAIDGSPVLSIRHLTKRSPTGSQASLTNLLLDPEDDAIKSIQDFETNFSGARGKRKVHRSHLEDLSGAWSLWPPTPPRSDNSLASSSATSATNDLTHTLQRSLDLDSGLGSSIVSEPVKIDAVQANDNALKPCKSLAERAEQGKIMKLTPSSLGNINTQPVDILGKAPSVASLRPVSEQQPSATKSISAFIPWASQQPNLSAFARNRFDENIFQPILQEARFSSFHPLAETLGSKTNKSIKCLRDLEQSLILEPLVGLIIYLTNGEPFTNIFVSKQFTVSSSLYRSFGEFSIQLVLDTFHHLSEIEQRRASDRPYDNGYFLDLVQQVGRLAARIGAARQSDDKMDSETTPTDDMDYTPYVSAISTPASWNSHVVREDEVTLEGGLGQTGQPAELVRWRDGEGISLRTNERFELQPGIKRQHSNESLDNAAERSMGRRRKSDEGKIVELRCSDLSCDKIFRRRCDLAKHQKTHLRPFKCPFSDCKYHEEGLAGEKERDRHINDKHSTNPQYFNCQFCPFKTKRDSNCKQHMEKKHGWNYSRIKVRSKEKGKQMQQQTPQTPSMSTPGASDTGTGSLNDSEGNVTPPTAWSVGVAPGTPPADPYTQTLFPLPLTPFLYPHSQTTDVDFGAHLDFRPREDTVSGCLDPSGLSHGSKQNPEMTSVDPLPMSINLHDSPERGTVHGVDIFHPQFSHPSATDFSPTVMGNDVFTPPHGGPSPLPDDTANYLGGMSNLPPTDFSLFETIPEHITATPVPDLLPDDAMDLYDAPTRDFDELEQEFVNPDWCPVLVDDGVEDQAGKGTH